MLILPRGLPSLLVILHLSGLSTLRSRTRRPEHEERRKVAAAEGCRQRPIVDNEVSGTMSMYAAGHPRRGRPSGRGGVLPDVASVRRKSLGSSSSSCAHPDSSSFRCSMMAPQMSATHHGNAAQRQRAWGSLGEVTPSEAPT
ncbi:hypothetical protein FB45DRAFT_386674 [Roridomyces roridus]|uniref:Secreted protein n=1 Tax=Roridomyces roridus TaxID=1738132 RepID=A0AAD7B240_9AGAR|nr:hypothetical protein FB45DRAFT_386674 [Roridomyces roridus]